MDDLRPTSWNDYIGQTKLKETLKLSINGSIQRDERLDHILLVGPPGAGKTSLAALVALEADMELLDVIAPVKPAVMQRYVTYFDGLLFIDEIHRMSAKDQEGLLPLLEDQYYENANNMRIENENLVIMAATTEPKKIIQPLWDRFLIKPPFDEYSDDEMAQIIMKMASRKDFTIPKGEAAILGRACAGVPRNAKAMLKMAMNLNSCHAEQVLKQMRITKDGLTQDHLNYLKILVDSGGCVGVDIIATHTGLPKEIILDLEKLLTKRKYIEFSKSGRVALPPTYELLKKKIKL